MNCPNCKIEVNHFEMRSKHCNNCGHEWEIINVTPLNDSNRHSEHYDCHCRPEIKTESGNVILVHNSFDGREGVEWANEVLSNDKWRDKNGFEIKLGNDVILPNGSIGRVCMFGEDGSKPPKPRLLVSISGLKKGFYPNEVIILTLKNK